MVPGQASQTTSDLRQLLDESSRVAEANARNLPLLPRLAYQFMPQGMPPRARQQYEAEHRRLQALPSSPELPLQVTRPRTTISPTQFPVQTEEVLLGATQEHPLAEASLLKQNFHLGNSSATARKIPGMAIESGWCGGLMPAKWAEGAPLTWALTCVNNGTTRRSQTLDGGGVKQEQTRFSIPAGSLNGAVKQEQNGLGGRRYAL